MTANFRLASMQLENLQAMENLLECGLCHKLLDNPYSTDCEHHFCKNCIEEALFNESKCPMCKLPQHPRDLARNPTFASIVSGVSKLRAALNRLETRRRKKRLLNKKRKQDAISTEATNSEKQETTLSTSRGEGLSTLPAKKDDAKQDDAKRLRGEIISPSNASAETMDEIKDDLDDRATRMHVEGCHVATTPSAKAGNTNPETPLTAKICEKKDKFEDENNPSNSNSEEKQQTSMLFETDGEVEGISSDPRSNKGPKSNVDEKSVDTAGTELDAGDKQLNQLSQVEDKEQSSSQQRVATSPLQDSSEEFITGEKEKSNYKQKDAPEYEGSLEGSSQNRSKEDFASSNQENTLDNNKEPAGSEPGDIKELPNNDSEKVLVQNPVVSEEQPLERRDEQENQDSLQSLESVQSVEATQFPMEVDTHLPAGSQEEAEQNAPQASVETLQNDQDGSNELEKQKTSSKENGCERVNQELLLETIKGAVAQKDQEVRPPLTSLSSSHSSPPSATQELTAAHERLQDRQARFKLPELKSQLSENEITASAMSPEAKKSQESDSGKQPNSRNTAFEELDEVEQRLKERQARFDGLVKRASFTASTAPLAAASKLRGETKDKTKIVSPRQVHFNSERVTVTVNHDDSPASLQCEKTVDKGEEQQQQEAQSTATSKVTDMVASAHGVQGESESNPTAQLNGVPSNDTLSASAPETQDSTQPQILITGISSDEDIHRCKEWIERLGGKYLHLYQADTRATHVIVKPTSTDDNGMSHIKVSPKYLFGLVKGSALVEPRWIEASNEAGHWVDEAPYLLKHADLNTVNRVRSGKEVDRSMSGLFDYILVTNEMWSPIVKAWLQRYPSVKVRDMNYLFQAMTSQQDKEVDSLHSLVGPDHMHDLIDDFGSDRMQIVLMELCPFTASRGHDRKTCVYCITLKRLREHFDRSVLVPVQFFSQAFMRNISLMDIKKRRSKRFQEGKNFVWPTPP